MLQLRSAGYTYDFGSKSPEFPIRKQLHLNLVSMWWRSVDSVAKWTTSDFRRDTFDYVTCIFMIPGSAAVILLRREVRKRALGAQGRRHAGSRCLSRNSQRPLFARLRLPISSAMPTALGSGPIYYWRLEGLVIYGFREEAVMSRDYF